MTPQLLLGRGPLMPSPVPPVDSALKAGARGPSGRGRAQNPVTRVKEPAMNTNLAIPDLKVSPLLPEHAALWDAAMTSIFTGMTRDALEFLHRRPDVIITQCLTSDTSLSVMCRRIRNKIGFDPNPVWVRVQCISIAVGRGLTSEP